jgi:hypothetical protein
MTRRGYRSGIHRRSFVGRIVLIATVGLFSVGSAAAASGSSQIGNGVRPADGTKAPFTASATDNIFGAGLTTPPDPGGNGGGVLPFEIAVPAGTMTVKFSHVAGRVSFAHGHSGGPDGTSGVDTNISACGGISGLMDTDSYFYLVGVFLDGGQPAVPPPTLNFTGDHSFKSLAPELGQVFFVGDGLTGTGTGKRQDFTVPSGATTLYLAFADAPNGSGPPGAYSDNKGFVSGNVDFNRFR